MDQTEAQLIILVIIGLIVFGAVVSLFFVRKLLLNPKSRKKARSILYDLFSNVFAGLIGAILAVYIDNYYKATSVLDSIFSLGLVLAAVAIVFGIALKILWDAKQ
ncbi:hypothetical protein HYV43_06960 [Candidatus Micrarchaeota archaeon]|nr:hypothetical protein [Candidatus Micrarchaeota archaeon]